MGTLLERPIANVTAEGYDSVIKALLEPNPFLLYAWLNLIFLKVHLNDRSLRVNADERAGTGTIAELYYWTGLHHIHCVARSPYTGVQLSSKALGSMFVIPARTGTTFGDFDYSDYYPGMAMLLRLGETAFICVLNDAGGAASILAEDIKKINGPLSAQQCRELLAHILR
jgi:hypothetical protein